MQRHFFFPIVLPILLDKILELLAATILKSENGTKREESKIKRQRKIKIEMMEVGREEESERE